MKKSVSLLKKVSLMIVAVSCLALIAVAVEHRYHHHPVVQNIQPTDEKPIHYDLALLNKFTSAIRSLDFNRSNCRYSGSVSLDDPNDTTNSVRRIEFTFNRSGKDYDYRLGPMELISRQGLNLFIQHDQRKVVVSGKALTMPPPLTDMSIITKNLSSEGYALINTIHGTKQTLSLINEHHLSCKELSVTLDVPSGKLKRIYSRLSDFGSPADKGKDRVIDVMINDISDQPDKSLDQAAARVLRRSAGKWQLTGEYKNYELISL